MTTVTPSRALRVGQKAETPDALQLQLETQDLPDAPPDHAVVEVLAAAVNPSDVKAALGLMPQAVWPRTPGRDFSARVVVGPQEWMGANVWGTGGDLGITRDGSHARYLVLPVAALVRRPEAVSAAAAGTVGVPFITAHEGLRRAGLVGRGQTVVVFGANGKVGQAAIQLATRAGAAVIGVERGAGRYRGHASQPVTMLDGTRADLGEAVLEASGGRGADIAYNTVGSPYFSAALQSLAVGGTQILISTIERSVPFDILGFYRRNLQLVGVDSLKLDVVKCAAILDALAPGFTDGSLRAFDVDAAGLVPLDQAIEAYQQVLAGSSSRVVFVP